MRAKQMRGVVLGLMALTVVLTIGMPAPSLALLQSEGTGFYCWGEGTLQQTGYTTSNARAVFDGGWMGCIAVINESETCIGWDQDTWVNLSGEPGLSDPSALNPLCTMNGDPGPPATGDWANPQCTGPTDPTNHPGTRWIGEIRISSYYQDTASRNYAQGITASRYYQIARCDRDGDGNFTNSDLNYVCTGTGEAPWCMVSAGTTDLTLHVSYNVDYCDYANNTTEHLDAIGPPWTPLPAPNDGICKDGIDDGCGGTCGTRITTYLVANLDADCDGTKENPYQEYKDPKAPYSAGLCLFWEWRLPGTSAPTYWYTGNLQARITVASQGEKTLNLSPAEGPTPVRVGSFKAYAVGGQTVVSWETESEEQVAGYNLYGLTLAGDLDKVNGTLMTALPPAPGGSTWRVADPGAAPGHIYGWVLGEVNLRGEEKLYGPFNTLVAEDSGEVAPAPGAMARTPHAAPAPARRTAAKAAAPAVSRTAGQAARLGVTAEGLHYIEAGTIATTLGVPVAAARTLISRGQFSLSNRGRLVAYTPAAGNAGIFFHGALPDSNFTGENVYWLTRGRGSLMATAQAGKPAAAAGGTFPSASRAEVDRWPQTALVTDPAGDFWVWDFLLAGDASAYRKSFTLRTDGAAASGSATLTVNLLGGADAPGQGTDHHVTVSLNGTPVGQGTWDGTQPASFDFTVSQSLLRDGDNQVTIEASLAEGVPYSFFWLDSLEVVYRRQYRAVGNALVLTGDGNPTVTVTGFTAGNIRVLDISNPARPILLQGLNVQADGAGYRVSFRPSSPAATYLVATAARVPSVAAHNFTGLARTENQADYLVIAPGELAGAAAGLALHRQGQGLVSKVVRLEDIYAEFNFGIAEPEAVRSFLTRARTWQTPHRYVVLAGKGTYDYRDNQGIGDNLLPVALVNTPYGLFSSDNYFADSDGDGVPEVAIGRLPATSADELLRLVARIENYEGSSGSWRDRVYLVADAPDPTAGNFPMDSATVATGIPGVFATTSINLALDTIDQDRTTLRDGLNSGAYLFNYIGHGGLGNLSNLNVFSSLDVPTLTNGDRRPLVAAMTCQAGRHELPGTASLAEALLKGADGGAIAVWTASGLSLNSDAVLLDKLFVRKATDGVTATVGDAVIASLQGFGAEGGLNRFMTEIYNLFGDPALRIR